MAGGTVRTDVAIVGAGFTGLSAAGKLCEAGVDFLVLEARDRVGGRVEAMRNGLGELIDSGGQFVCEDMPELMALISARGKTRVESHMQGTIIGQPAMTEEARQRTYAASMTLRDRMNVIDPGDPAIAGMTVAAWLAGQGDPPDTKAAFRSMIEGLWCLPMEAIPLWYMIDNDRRITNETFELQYFVAETMHSLALDMAADLGDRLRLGATVRRIEHGPDGVRLTVGGGSDFTVDARLVLVAVPPATASRLDYVPALPVPLGRALGVWRSGSVIKVLLRYRRPFWRERGLSGMIMWRDPPGLFAFDMSMDAERPMLGMFVAGPRALEWGQFDAPRFRAELMAKLTAALGPEAGQPIDFTMRNWIADRWSGGAYSDLVVDVDAVDAENRLLAGAPPILFACSEISPSFPGYIEGAIVAGRAGAARCLALRS